MTPKFLMILCLLFSIFSSSHEFSLGPSLSNRQKLVASTALYMGDHSSATLFQAGDTVTVIHDVIKAGRNLKGLRGEVVETWEKCDVDPTCCCAEWVDEGLSVHVQFNVSINDINGNRDSLLANNTFVHYFAESELENYKQTKDTDHLFDAISGEATVP